MRPIKLTMTAFGPYSGVEIIDFRELEGRNLFLINGPTGAGKTTIFDAISFAMFGEANGSLRDADTLRSQFSEPEVLTEVTLDFELRGESYRIHRIPVQMKPKARGDGLTKQSADATLIMDGKKPIVGHTAVTKEIEKILGISADQFRQIMMIPQGEFRKLLTSDSKEREKVLRKLFDTSLFNTFQMKMDEEAKKIYRTIKDDRQLRDYELKKIQTEDESLLSLLAMDNMNMDVILEMTRDKCSSDQEEQMDIEGKLGEQNKAVESIVKKREQVEQKNKRFKQLENYRKDLDQKKAQGDAIDLKRVKIEKSVRAMQIEPYEQAFRKSKKQLEESELKHKGLSVELTVMKEKLLQVSKEYEEVTSQEYKLKVDKQLTELERLRGFQEKAKSLELTEKTIITLSQDLQKEQVQKEKLKSASEQKKEEVQKAKKVLEEINTSKVVLSNQQSKKHMLDERMKAIEAAIKIKERVIKGEKFVANLNRDLLLIDESVASILKEYKKANMSFHLNQAAVLAKELEDGMPCPVCGSKDHPCVATFTENEVSEDDLNKLESVLKAEEKKQTDKQGDIKAKSGLLEELKGQLALQLEELNIFEEKILVSRSETEKEQYALEVEISKLTHFVDSETALKDSVKVLEEEIEASTKTLEALEVDFKKQSDELLIKRNELAIIQKEVPENYRKLSPLKEAICRIEDERKQMLEKQERVSRSHNTIKGEVATLDGQVINLKTVINEESVVLDEQRKDLKKRIADGDFEDSKAYIDAKVKLDELETLKKSVKDYEQSLHTLNEQILSLEKETEGLRVEPLDLYEQKLEEIKGIREGLLKKKGDLEKRLSVNQSVISNVSVITERMGDAEKVYSVVGKLATVAMGRNLENITFERYVLAAFLEDILKAANIRLNKMTQGRYVLSRTKEIARKNAQAGLELEVFDNYTGQSRHVKTLSGGEGFKASLAMALGLSDVVQSYSGGVQLDTMFIDEGFGTLDQESLDYAISCLIDLQEAGRLVGIISHVQELKERMDARLEVTMSHSGSKTAFIVQ